MDNLNFKQPEVDIPITLRKLAILVLCCTMWWGSVDPPVNTKKLLMKVLISNSRLSLFKQQCRAIYIDTMTQLKTYFFFNLHTHTIFERRMKGCVCIMNTTAGSAIESPTPPWMAIFDLAALGKLALED